MDGEYPQELRCPICFEIPEKEIFQCNNGHTICSECCQSLSECPQCRIKYEAKKIRCRALESMRDSLKVDCTYKWAGCPGKIARSELASHSQNCKFRGKIYTFCEHLGYHCNFLVNTERIGDTLDHLEKAHQFIRRKKSTSVTIHLEEYAKSTPTSKSFWTPVLLELPGTQGAIVFLNMYSSKDKTCSFSCIHIPSEAAEVESVNCLIMYFVKTTGNCKDPDLQWIISPFHIEKTGVAVGSPYYQFPQKLLQEKFMTDGGLTIQCNFVSGNTIEREIADQEVVYTFNVGTITETEDPQQPIFSGVSCNNCKKKDLVGFRYKCLQCIEYDLCKVCMDKNKHSHHAFGLIRNLEQQAEIRAKTLFPNGARPMLTSIPFGLLGIVRVEQTSCKACHDHLKQTNGVYICLKCRPEVVYCDVCFATWENYHPKDHVFAVAESTAKAGSVICNMPKEY